MKSQLSPPDPASYPPVEQLSYEEAMSELEQIVAALETSPGSLDASLVLFQRGHELAQRCKDLLNQADLKVKLITGEDFENVLP